MPHEPNRAKLPAMKSAPECLTASPPIELAAGRMPAPLVIPVLALLAASAGIGLLNLDMACQHLFWSPTKGWLLKDHPVVQCLYRYGTWPALVAGGVGGVVGLGSWLVCRWRRWRSLGLFLATLLVMGPGLMVNVVFKDHFGRARPVQTIEFGGKQPFAPLGHVGLVPGGKSFPSGHASMGFYWLGLFVFFWNRQRRWAWAFGAGGLLWGVIMGLGRMAQGGHWASDVMWSAGLVYLTAWGLMCLPAWRRWEDAV